MNRTKLVVIAVVIGIGLGLISCQFVAPIEEPLFASQLCPTIANPSGLAQHELPDHGIYLLTQDEILWLQKNGNEIGVANRISHTSDNYERLVVHSSDAIYASSRNAIVSYNQELQELGRFEFDQELTDFAIHETYAFALIENSLWIINFANPQLPRFIKQLEFPADKPGHHILIRGTRAYVLDNVVMPVYLHWLEIEDPANPALTTLEWEGVNPYLPDQFVDENGWYVLERSNTLFGMFQSVSILSTEPPLIETGSFYLPSWARDPNLDETDPNFFMLQQIAVIHGLLIGAGTEVAAEGYPEGNLVVGAFRPNSDTPDPVHHICLADYANGQQPKASEMLVDANNLYIAGANGLYILDATNPSQLQFLGLVQTTSDVLSIDWAETGSN